MTRLFETFAHRYDLHTPPHHYADDHAWLVSTASALSKGATVLDVGCGTGILVERLLAAGLDAHGIDASPGMVAVAQRRCGHRSVRQRRMQDIDEVGAYDVIVSTSWSFNYVADWEQADQVLGRLHRALRRGGRLLLQVAHAPNATGELYRDVESGPTGLEADIEMLYRFRPLSDDTLAAEYVYACLSANELVAEEHCLHAANAQRLAEHARRVGFSDLTVRDSWSEAVHLHSVSPWIVGAR